MSPIQALKNLYQFQMVGRYLNETGELITCEYNHPDKKLNQKCTLCYAIIVDEKIRYIGSTKQGHRRPTGYHKNNVMKNVKDGIKIALTNSQKVEVYTRVFEEDYERDGLQLNVYQGYEIALIKLFNPEWNRHHIGQDS